jgi:WD40 repeat protein
VGRDCHSLAVFGLNFNSGSERKETESLFCVQGDESSLSYPGGVAVHPSGKWLAVANRGRFGITLYRKKGSAFEFESTPFQSISDLALHDLATPQGIDFSPDGNSLIVTHKEFYLNEDPKGKSGISIFKCCQGSNPGLEREPSYVYHFGDRALHSIAFHPTEPLMAVTDENGSVEVHRLPAEDEPMTKVASIATLVGEEGPKGVGFSPDGNLLAACTVFNEVLLYKVETVFKLPD